VVLSDTESALRATASDRLARGEINFIFTVDIDNEGVDIPEINTVLFLRPTGQRSGRKLRLLLDQATCIFIIAETTIK
jgi:superfamily II DNA or RNA helicase